MKMKKMEECVDSCDCSCHYLGEVGDEPVMLDGSTQAEPCCDCWEAKAKAEMIKDLINKVADKVDVNKDELYPGPVMDPADDRCVVCGAIWAPPPSLFQAGCAKCWV